MNEKTLTPMMTIVLAAVAGVIGFMLQVPQQTIDNKPGISIPNIFPDRPSIFPSAKSADEMVINKHVALTWVRVGDRTNIYVGLANKTDRVIEIIATPTQISVVGEGRRAGDVGASVP